MNMLGSWPMGFGIFGFFGTVSMNMFIHRPMSFGIFGFFGTVSKNMLISCRSTVSRNILISLYANMCVHSCRSSCKLHQAS